MEIGSLLREQTSALLLIEEDDGLRRKSFGAGGGDGCGGVGRPSLDRVSGALDLGVGAAVEQNQEAETRGLEVLSLSVQEFVLAPGGLFSQ